MSFGRIFTNAFNSSSAHALNVSKSMADELAASSAGHKELAKIPGGVLMRDMAHYSLGCSPFRLTLYARSF